MHTAQEISQAISTQVATWNAYAESVARYLDHPYPEFSADMQLKYEAWLQAFDRYCEIVPHPTAAVQ